MKPVLVLGPARSGTRLMRDLLASRPDATKVPFDVNSSWLPSWRAPHDEVRRPATIDEARRVRSSIIRLAKPSSTPAHRFLVEKTVSNCLRPDYVESVFPEARYVVVLRNPLDTIESAMRMWRSTEQRLRYSISKLATLLVSRNIAPLTTDIVTRAMVLARREERTWGPRYDGIAKDTAHLSLSRVVARQWARCASVVSWASRTSAEVEVVWYDDIVTSEAAFVRLVERVQGSLTSSQLDAYRHTVHPERIGSGRELRQPDRLDVIDEIEELVSTTDVLSRARAALEEGLR